MGRTLLRPGSVHRLPAECPARRTTRSCASPSTPSPRPGIGCWRRIASPHVITDQLHEPLLRLNPETQEMEPALAESWEFSADGTRLVFHLRQGVRFSDGDPFGAEDVAFTFEALYEPSTGSPLVETAQIDGKPFGVEVIDEWTVSFTLPRRTATVERVFDSLAILPSHLLKESLKRGSIAADTGLGADPEEHRRARPVSSSRSTSREKGSSSSEIPTTSGPPTKRDASRGSNGWFSTWCPTRARASFAFARERSIFWSSSRPTSSSSFAKRGAPTGSSSISGPACSRSGSGSTSAPRRPSKSTRGAGSRTCASGGRFRSRSIAEAWPGWSSPAARPPPRDPSRPRTPSGTTAPSAKRPTTRKRRGGSCARPASRGTKTGRLRDGRRREVSFTVLTNAGNEAHARLGAFIQEDLARIGIHAPTSVIEASSLLARITGTLRLRGLSPRHHSDRSRPFGGDGASGSRERRSTSGTRSRARRRPSGKRASTSSCSLQMSELDIDATPESLFRSAADRSEQLPILDLGRSARSSRCAPPGFESPTDAVRTRPVEWGGAFHSVMEKKSSPGKLVIHVTDSGRREE